MWSRWCRWRQAAHAIIREVDPAAQIVSPSVVPNFDGVDWLDDYLTQGGGNYADVIGAHFYLNGAQPPEGIPPLVASVHRVLAEHGQGDKPLWNTESNFGYVQEDILITGR